MTKKKSTKPETSHTINLSEELTINFIGKIRNKILKDFGIATNITMKWNSPVQIDLAGIQLLEAIRKSADKKGKNLVIKVQPLKESTNLLQNTGFSDFVNSLS